MQKMTNYLIMFTFMLIHTYLYNKDLILKTIENHMVSRQQTQCQEYFKNSQDAIIVVSGNPEKNSLELVLSN